MSTASTLGLICRLWSGLANWEQQFSAALRINKMSRQAVAVGSSAAGIVRSQNGATASSPTLTASDVP